MRKLLITAPRKVEIVECPDDELGPTSLRLKCLFNGISHGTEMNFYRGTAPQFTHDIADGLFRKAEADQKLYPIWHGYETVGRVVELGKDVTGYKEGDIVWTGNQHADTVVCDTTVSGRPFFCEKMPLGAKPVDGIFLALAGVALDGHLTGEVKLGECCVISGLGCIGLFNVQMAVNAGAYPVIAIDPVSARREAAKTFGAHHAFDPLQASLAEKVLELNDARGADVVIETSGNWKALHAAVRCCASGYGRLVAVGFYQGGGGDLRLGEEFHHSSFQAMGASRILAVNHRREPAAGRAWDRLRVYHALAQMLGDGRLKTEGLLSHTFPFERADEAFRMIDTHPEQTIKTALILD